MKKTAFLFLLIYGISCQSTVEETPAEIRLTGIDLEPGELVAVVAAPAGDIPKYRYYRQSQTLRIDTTLRKAWDFLPLPANQAYLVNTLAPDQLPIECMILSTAQEIGDLLPIKPMGAIELRRPGQSEIIILAIPVEQSKRIIEADNFLDFMLDYDAIKYLIQNWYIHYKGIDEFENITWQNEQFALSFIKQGLKAADSQ